MTSGLIRFAIFFAACGLSRWAHAETPASSGVITSQILTVLMGMAVVLGLILAMAWLMKRFAPHSYGSNGVLRVIGGAAVGQRERVVIVEIDSTWLVLGVAPGSVSALHQMPRAVNTDERRAPTNTLPPFSRWLRERLEKRSER